MLLATVVNRKGSIEDCVYQPFLKLCYVAKSKIIRDLRCGLCDCAIGALSDNLRRHLIMGLGHTVKPEKPRMSRWVVGVGGLF
jgi:hypothetical protein